MRTRTMFALVLGVTAVVAACSGGSGLTGKTWQLTSITEKVPAFQGVVPAADQPNYTIDFKSDLTLPTAIGEFTAKADCNQLAGTFTTTGSDGLTIAPGPMTMAACPPESLSDQYVAALGKAESYSVANGQLTITLIDEGTLVFK